MGEIKHNDEIGIPEFLERCVGGFPPNVLPPVAIAGHRIAWTRFKETGDPGWQDVVQMTLRAVMMARTATEEEAAVILAYLRELPLEQWWSQKGWPRHRVRDKCVADARRCLAYLESPTARRRAARVAREARTSR